MPIYQFLQVDVFTDAPFGGNPLAVFPDAAGLTGQQMQQLALELNLSETTFVLPPDMPGADFKVRIFTPKAELPFAGHPLVGTHWVLAHLGRVKLAEPITEVTFELGVGLRTARHPSHQTVSSFSQRRLRAPSPLDQLAGPGAPFAVDPDLGAGRLRQNLAAQRLARGLPLS